MLLLTPRRNELDNKLKKAPYQFDAELFYLSPPWFCNIRRPFISECERNFLPGDCCYASIDGKLVSGSPRGLSGVIILGNFEIVARAHFFTLKILP